MLITTQRSPLSPWLPSPLALKCCPRCPRSLSSSHAPTSSSGEYRHSHTRKESRRTPTTTVPLPTDIVTFRTASLYRETNNESAPFGFPDYVRHQLGMGVADADSGPFQFTQSRTGRSKLWSPASLVPRPFPPPVFDRILYAKTEGEGLSRSNLPPEVWCPPGAGYFEVNRPPLKLFAPLRFNDLAQRTVDIDPLPGARAT